MNDEHSHKQPSLVLLLFTYVCQFSSCLQYKVFAITLKSGGAGPRFLLIFWGEGGREGTHSPMVYYIHHLSYNTSSSEAIHL